LYGVLWVLQTRKTLFVLMPDDFNTVVAHFRDKNLAAVTLKLTGISFLLDIRSSGANS
jgi:hypothetical protein